jgi:glycosyltransferase involved in cell wall biosynthesis
MSTGLDLRVLMLGPGLAVRGGVAAVERAILAALPRGIAATHIATMVEGSKPRKLATYLRALVQAWLRLRERPDVVHIHFASRASSVRKMMLARLALALGCKVIMHAHGGGYPDYWASLTPRARQRVAQVLRRAHAVIVLGERWRGFFASIGVPPERLVVFSNPVALPPAPPVRAPGARAVFVFLGLVSEAKGVFDLVEALASLPAGTRARMKLVIAGNGEHAALRRRVAHHRLENEVEILGWVDAPQRDALLASADAFVLPSHGEALPMALLEAMAWGLPAVCTPVGSVCEVARHEHNALLAPVGDVAALARALERLALDHELRARMGTAARRSVEGMAVESYIEKLRALYEAVAWAR